LISPHFFEGVVIEIGVRDPAVMCKGETAEGAGEMDVEIAFKVSAESMDCEINSRYKSFLQRQLFNDACGDSRGFIHEVAVDPEEIPKDIRHGEGDMLPFGVGKSVKTVFYPDVGSFFTAGRAEPGLAGVRDFNAVSAFGADSEVIAEERSSANHDFQDVDDNAESDKLTVFEKELPPVAIIKENGSQLDTADIFHVNSITKENSKGKLPPKGA
jgi:hypothetical protein